MNLEEAKIVAGAFITKITPFCERVEVAGSVRRKKLSPKDIEVICIPKVRVRVQPVLFGEPIKDEVNFLHDYMLGLREQDMVKTDRTSKDGKRAPFGPRYYRITYGGYPIDLFTVLPPAEWGVIFTIRTGPAEYSHWLVTEALRRGMKVMDGQLFRRKIESPTLVGARDFDEMFDKIPCTEEREFFQALGLKWVEPEERRVETE